MGFQLPTDQLVKIAWFLAINHMLDLFASEGYDVFWTQGPLKKSTKCQPQTLLILRRTRRWRCAFQAAATGPNRWGETSEISGFPMETSLQSPPGFKKKGEIFMLRKMIWYVHDHQCDEERLKKKTNPIPSRYLISSLLCANLFILTVPVLIATSDWIRITMITGFETFNARLYRAAARRGSSTKCQDSKKDATQKGGEFSHFCLLFWFRFVSLNFFMYPSI